MPLPPPIKPNTIINTKGKTKLNTTADGLRKIERKLALVMASIALNWLYFMQQQLSCKTKRKKGERFGKHKTGVVYSYDKRRYMKKVKKTNDVHSEEKRSKVNEAASHYKVATKIISLKEFTYQDFKKVADKVPFTQAEWSDILHISERTLQRYAKDNHLFAPINAERVLLINKVLQEAQITFGKSEKFYEWIKRNPYMMEGNLSIQSLSTYEGIQNVLTQLGRIQQGVFA